MADIIKTEPNSLAAATPLPLDQNPAAVYLSSLAGSGKRSQAQALAVIAELLTGQPDPRPINWAALRFQHTQAIRAALADGKPRPLAVATINRILAALRGVLAAAFDLGQISGEDYQRAIRVKNILEDALPTGRGLTAGEVRALMDQCGADPTPAGARDAAVIALLYSGGMRREELVRIDISDFDPGEARFTITGKRNKQRFIYLSNGALDALQDWLIVRGDNPGPLFVAINKAGVIGQVRLSTQAIYTLLIKRARAAGVAKFTPHDLRRSFISDLLEAGADIATVAKMAGHANVRTTARYDRRPEESKRAAAGLLHVPYTRRGKVK